MQVICHPSKLVGALPAIPSKSDAHRVLICAALADRPTLVRMNTRLSQDVAATMRCLEALGAQIAQTAEGFHITPIAQAPQAATLDCGESGATLRFLLPVAAALGTEATFIGHGRLPERPIADILTALQAGGVEADAPMLPLTLHGRLNQGVYRLPGNISSQYITGFLLALAYLGGGRIALDHALESAAYVDMTISTLAHFGVSVQIGSDGFTLSDGARLRSSGAIQVEGDWSNMGFFLAAGAIGGDVTCTALTAETKQGDARVTDLLADFGALIESTSNSIRSAARTLNAIHVDVREIPDMVPLLSVIASVAKGTTSITGAMRLRLKESDRLESVTRMITALGGQITQGEDSLTIEGVQHLSGGIVDCMGDHRIAMAGAIAALISTEPVTLNGAEAVQKSYPDFFEDYQALGGICDVIYDRGNP